MAVADEIRVQALGFSVDDTPGGGAAGAIDAWRTTGGAGGRNALNTAAQGGDIDPVPNRAINRLYVELASVDDATAAFDGRFTDVVGEETGADQATFDSIGIKLIPAIAGWTDDFTNTDTWTCAHNLHSQFVSVRAVKSDGTVMVPEIDYTNADNCTLHFAENVTGIAIIRR